MKKLLLLLVLFISAEVLAQPGDTINSSTDSTLIKLQKFQDSILTALPPIDSNEIRENFDRNINGILEMQKNRRAKEKRAAMIRIAIGVAFLIVLVIGLRRKTVKK